MTTPKLTAAQRRLLRDIVEFGPQRLSLVPSSKIAARQLETVGLVTVDVVSAVDGGEVLDVDLTPAGRAAVEGEK